MLAKKNMRNFYIIVTLVFLLPFFVKAQSDSIFYGEGSIDAMNEETADDPATYDGNPGRPQGDATYLHSDDQVPIQDVMPSNYRPGSMQTTSDGNASFEYRLLEGVPGFYNRSESISLPQLISALYKFGIWTAGIASMFMIVIGGFMYMTSAGNTSRAGTAKGVITDAILGLIIAMTSYLFLYVLNPDLVKINPVTLREVVDDEIVMIDRESIYSEMETFEGMSNQALAQIVYESGVLISSGDCKTDSGEIVSPELNMREIASGGSMTACNSDCMNVPCSGSTSPSESMMKSIMAVQRNGLNFRVNSIAGGNHSANSKHYEGKAVDVVAIPPTTLAELEVAFRSTEASMSECDYNGNISIPCSSANHVHVQF